MKITVNSTLLAKALRAAAKVIPAKPNTPVLECFKMDAAGTRLTVTATNLEITVKAPVRIEELSEDGSCAVPAKKFLEHVSLLPDCDVLIETTDSTVTITWAKGKTKMPLMNVADYPTITDPAPEQMMNMPAQQLLAALGVTIPACAKDIIRPQLCGVHFDILENVTRIVASDTRTLTYDTVECSTGTPDGFTIPTAAAALLKGSIHKESTIVRLTHDRNTVCFNLGDIIVMTRKVVGKYPNYMAIIPSGDTCKGTATVNREGLVGSLRRLAACAGSLKMTLTPLSILFTGRNTETGSAAEEDCECNYVGEEMAIGINPLRFLDILENITTEQICLAVSDPRKPIIASASEEERDRALSMFMPVLI